MASMEAFYKFNEQLLSLPMRDVTFLAKLTRQGLLPGDLKAKVMEKSSLAEAADYVLDNSIKKDLKNDNEDSFVKLLSAMEEYDSRLSTLAAEIRGHLPHKPLSMMYQLDDSPNPSG